MGSVKGVLLVGAVVNARRARDAGTVSPDAMDARLSGAAVELLEQKIEPTQWYPVGPFCELVDLVWELSGARDPAYLEQQGAVAADRLFDSGIYLQLDFAKRSGKVASRSELVRQSKLITTITGSLYDFLSFGVELGERALEIEFGNASEFGDCLIHTTVGFMSQINQHQGSGRRWSGWREAPDRVRFSMELPGRLS